MKQAFSKSWKSSKKPSKQRKYRYNAPLHIKQKFMSVHLSKELREKYARRNFPIRKGDKVKVLRGQFKGRENKVEQVMLSKLKVYITGIDRSKKEGSKVKYPFEPSNLMITELNLEDKKRKEALERNVKKVEGR